MGGPKRFDPLHRMKRARNGPVTQRGTPLMPRIRKAARADAVALAPELRKEDLDDITATTGKNPLDVLNYGIASSDPCYTILDGDGKPFCIFGAIPDKNNPHSALVWLLGSNGIERHSRFFLRHSRFWIEKLHERYGTLWNYVDARNGAHIRWLKWCGFAFPRLIEKYGMEQRPFFECRRG
jgi:hypothetical protein